MNPQDKTRLSFECARWLIGHPRTRQTAQAVLADLAAQVDPGVLPDMYGQGELINDFEKQVAALLGKPAAVFMPSGTLAQPIALRIHADRAHSQHVAFHPTCHLEIHEQKGYQLLHGLHGVLVGSPYRQMTSGWSTVGWILRLIQKEAVCFCCAQVFFSGAYPVK